VTLISPDSLAITPEGISMLTDGKRGAHDYAYNWLSFPGKNLEAIIDLGEVKQVRRIESAYFQYGYWLRLFPANVEYFISADGKKFKPVGNIANTLPIDQYGGQQRDFIAEFDPQAARYIKVIAHTIGNTPGWHPGAGRPANMLIDEIVVE
jgi:hexosaminidase